MHTIDVAETRFEWRLAGKTVGNAVSYNKNASISISPECVPFMRKIGCQSWCVRIPRTCLTWLPSHIVHAFHAWYTTGTCPHMGVWEKFVFDIVALHMCFEECLITLYDGHICVVTWCSNISIYHAKRSRNQTRDCLVVYVHVHTQVHLIIITASYLSSDDLRT